MDIPAPESGQHRAAEVDQFKRGEQLRSIAERIRGLRYGHRERQPGRQLLLGIPSRQCGNIAFQVAWRAPGIVVGMPDVENGLHFVVPGGSVR